MALPVKNKSRSDRIASIQRAGAYLKRHKKEAKDAAANTVSLLLSSGGAFGVGYMVGNRHRAVAADPNLTTDEEREDAMKLGGVAPLDAVFAGSFALVGLTGLGGKRVKGPALALAKGAGGYAIGSAVSEAFYSRAINA